MFNKAERIIALRNLRPKRKEGFLKVISIFSFLGIMLGVAVLIIVMSVMNGFRTELINKIVGFNAHVTVKPYDNPISLKKQNIDALLDDVDENMSTKFKKHDLIGIPFQIIIGSKSKDDLFEFKEVNTESKALSLKEIKEKLKK